jgi:hypothetical protein
MKEFLKIILAAQLPILLSSFFYSVSAQTDSLEIVQNADSTSNIVQIDSSKKTTLYPLIKQHGSLFNINSVGNKINKVEPQKVNYIGVHDVIYQKSNAFPLFTNNFGKRDRLGFYGYFQNAVSFNGIQQFGPGISGFSYWTNSVESSENIEIYCGAEAIPFANNSGGSLINFQEIVYNTKKPFVRAWAADINDDLLNFEGTWAQNFAPNWNFYTNYRSMAGNSRFQNSDFRSRNLRIGFRNTLDSNSQITYTYQHNNNFVASNSGIDPALSLDVDGNFTDSPVNSVVHFESLNRRNKTHNFLAHYSTKFDTNNIKALNVSAFANYNIIHEKLGELDFTNDEEIEKFNNYSIGANASYEQYIGNIFIKGIAQISYLDFAKNKVYNNINYFNYNIGGLISIKNKNFKPYASMKLSTFLDETFLDFGGGLKLNFWNLPMKIDFSHSNIVPNLYQNEANIEKHNLFFIKTNFIVSKTNINFDIYNRNISDQIIYGLNLTNNEIVGFRYLDNQNLNITGFSSRIKFKAFENLFFNYDDTYIEIKVIANPFVSGRSPFPKLFTDLRSFISIPRGKSEANIGFSWKTSFETNGYGFNDFYDIYFVDPYQNLPNQLLNFEFFALLRLNHAWLKLSFTNPFAEDIYYLAHHRALNQYFKMSFNWTIN